MKKNDIDVKGSVNSTGDINIGNNIENQTIVYNDLNALKREIISPILKRVKELNMKKYIDNIDEINNLFEIYKLNIELLAEVGYILSDIYERNSEFIKSKEITFDIIGVYRNKCEREFKEKRKGTSRRQKLLELYIECIYNLTIADIDDISEKSKILDFVGREFESARIYKDIFINDEEAKIEDRMYINSIFNSNFAAFLINRGKVQIKKENSDIVGKDYFENAREIHEDVLKERLKLLKLFENNPKKYEKINSKVGMSYRNIGTVYFYLGEYDKSIKNNEEAMKIFEKISDHDQYCQTLDCITGSVIKKWQKDSSTFNIEEFDFWRVQMIIISNYYKKAKNHIRYKNALIRKSDMEKIIDNLPNTEIKKYAKILINNFLK